jgi:hypothetical protein
MTCKITQFAQMMNSMFYIVVAFIIFYAFLFIASDIYMYMDKNDLSIPELFTFVFK